MDEDEEVIMIASGYEWTCKSCEHLNHEIEVKSEVTCEVCGKTFEVAYAEHAYE